MDFMVRGFEIIMEARRVREREHVSSIAIPYTAIVRNMAPTDSCSKWREGGYG
jgi:hypothetical protein